MRMPPLLRSQETLVPAQHLCSTRSASSKHLKTVEGLPEALCASGVCRSCPSLQVRCGHMRQGCTKPHTAFPTTQR
jgi:hypothetical protein